MEYVQDEHCDVEVCYPIDLCFPLELMRRETVIKTGFLEEKMRMKANNTNHILKMMWDFGHRSIMI